MTNVGTVSGAGSNKKPQKNERSSFITVKSGDTVSGLAKKFGMSTEEFMKWTGLKKTHISRGDKINIPTDNVPQGKGIIALAKKYNMTLEEFGKLNNLPKPYKNYVASKDEKFYIIPLKTESKKTSDEKPVQKKTPSQLQKTVDRKPESKPVQTTQSSASDNKKKWGSSYTPKELGENIFQKSSDYYGAVGRPDFDALISEINSKNASAVIQIYSENPKNKKHESLINTITSEIRSNKDARKDAVMKVYDALAAEKNTPADKRTAFESELNAQFDSWGMVNTEKLDKIIQEMIDSETAPSAVSGASKPKSAGKKANEKVIKGGFETAVGGQRSVSSNGVRPPIPVNEKGEVIAEVIKFTPSNPNGPLKGKTIMVNAGHGWKGNKTFDIGTHATDSKGKDIQEWYKNRNFADRLISQLSSQGATVIYTTGGAAPVCEAKEKFKADLLISLHCNSVGNSKKNGLEVFYPEGSASGKKLAELAENHLDKLVSFGKQGGPNDHCVTKSDVVTQHKSIGILQRKKGTVPSILIEMGYQSNDKDLRNIDSKQFQQNSMQKIVLAIKDFYGIK